VAASNVNVMVDALSTNRREVLAAIDVYLSELGALKAALEGGNDEDLRARLAAARARRAAWQAQSEDNRAVAAQRSAASAASERL
jgi:prephenate dehydrogenase